MYVYIHISIYLSIYLSVCLSIYLSIHPSIHLSIYLSICVCVCVYACVHIYIIKIYIYIYMWVCGYGLIKSFLQCLRTCHRIHISCPRLQEIVHVSQNLCTFHRSCARFTRPPLTTFLFNCCGMDGSHWGLLTRLRDIYICVCMIYIYICICMCIYICACFLYIMYVHIHTYMYIHPTVFENVCIPILRHFWCSP